ncbi:MAG: glycerate kinase [Eubacterium sp.]
MKILIAPDSFKGSLSAEQVCDCIEEAAVAEIKGVRCTKLPVSDGGEGMVEALLSVKGGERIACLVTGPLGEKVSAEYGILTDGTAVIEMASASGLPLVPEGLRNPMETSTFGTGELIADAAGRGCTQLILGIGGSSTNDGGLGAANALGMRFYNEAGQGVKPCGKSLKTVHKIDHSALTAGVKKMKITIACDVNNPLCGSNGSAFIYGPQKGADPEMIKHLDAGLSNLADIIERDTHKELRHLPGIGAAGGMALPFVAFLGAELRPGLEIVLDFLDFDKNLKDVDVVITGEGRTDKQSAMGKVLTGVCRRAKKQGVPVIALSGALEPGYESLYEEGLSAAFAACSSTKPLSWQMENGAENLTAAARNLFKLLQIKL